MPTPNTPQQSGQQKQTGAGSQPGQDQNERDRDNQDLNAGQSSTSRPEQGREGNRSGGRPQDDRDPDSPTRGTQRPPGSMNAQENDMGLEIDVDLDDEGDEDGEGGASGPRGENVQSDESDESNEAGPTPRGKTGQPPRQI